MTIQELIAFLDEEEQNGNEYTRYRITFAQPHDLVVNLRSKRKSVVTMEMRFFYNTRWCYLLSKRSGFPIEYYFPADGISIERITEEEKTNARKSKMKSLLPKFHLNAWDDVKKELVEKLQNGKPFMIDSDLKPRNITNLFSKNVLEHIKESFENKSAYSYHDCKQYSKGAKREYSVEMRECDDKIFRAWFSSEYVGCGNGDYYILINPTTALFVEKD